MTAKDEKWTGPAPQAVEDFSGRIMPLGEISHKKMFGGYGVFETGTMFALVTAEGVVHLKAGEANQARFENMGASKHGRMPYYQIPAIVLADDALLLEWTQEAIEVSKAAKK